MESGGTTDTLPKSEWQIKIADTNIASVMPVATLPQPWYMQYWYIFVSISAVAISALSIYSWKMRKLSASTKEHLSEGATSIGHASG